MKMLFTGAKGFVGKNIHPILQELYSITTLGTNPHNDCQIDLANEVPSFNDKYDIILHAAGKAHIIPRNEEEEKSFFDINLQGTKNLCTGLEKTLLPKAFIFISTVAVYGCNFGEKITEDHPLNGKTPYALSKIQAEQFLIEWCRKNHITLSIIRPSLIAGPCPPGNLGSMINGIKTGRYLSIAGGKARKSIVMVEDIGRLISSLAEKGGIYNICDDGQPTFRQLETMICRQLNKKAPLSIPYWLAKSLALIGDCIGNKAPINSLKLKKITESLTFSNEKAKKELDWNPMNVIENFKIK